MYPEGLPQSALCHVDGGHRWVGGACANCDERLRCGACMRFVTVEGLDKHIAEECPVKWEEYEGAQDVA